MFKKGAQVQGGASHEEESQDTPTKNQTQEENAEVGDQGDYQLARDMPRRVLKPPAKLQNYHVYPEDEDITGYAYVMTGAIESVEPGSYREAMVSPDSDKWTEASDEDMTSLKKNGMWVLVDRDENERPIGCRWLYKKKEGITKEEGPMFKERLVAKGFS